jgi:hypothetical protein
MHFGFCNGILHRGHIKKHDAKARFSFSFRYPLDKSNGNKKPMDRGLQFLYLFKTYCMQLMFNHFSRTECHFQPGNFRFVYLFRRTRRFPRCMKGKCSEIPQLNGVVFQQQGGQLVGEGHQNPMYIRRFQCAFLRNTTGYSGQVCFSAGANPRIITVRTPAFYTGSSGFYNFTAIKIYYICL